MAILTVDATTKVIIVSKEKSTCSIKAAYPFIKDIINITIINDKQVILCTVKPRLHTYFIRYQEVLGYSVTGNRRVMCTKTILASSIDEALQIALLDKDLKGKEYRITAE